MHSLNHHIKKVFVLYNYFCFVSVFIIFFPFIYIFSRSPIFYPLLNRIRKIWAILGCAFSGIFMDKLIDPELDTSIFLDKSKAFIFCCNHTSYLDTLVMSQVAQGSFFYMGKKGLMKNPVLRIFFETIDIAFERDSKTDSYKAFKLAEENLNKGRSLIIFPEGSITVSPPKLRPFKSGAFKLAMETGTPIVPVSILNSWDIFYGNGQNGAKPGIIKYYIHQPIYPINLGANPEVELRKKVFSIIQNKVDEYCINARLNDHWSPETSSLVN